MAERKTPSAAELIDAEVEAMRRRMDEVRRAVEAAGRRRDLDLRRMAEQIPRFKLPRQEPTPPPPKPKLPDGPHAPNVLVWEGESYALPQKLWAMVEFMWKRERVTLEELQVGVWGALRGKEYVCLSTVKSTVSRTNKALEAIGCPVRFKFHRGHLQTTHP